MGAIYLADDHPVDDRTVAIKVMLDYFDPHNPQAMKAAKARFRQEGKTLAGLSHSAIPMIFDFFQEGSHNYIVMQYIEGDNLEQQLTREDATTGHMLAGQPYSQEDVIEWGIKLCRVLEYLANRQPESVVHQDIKPANLVLARETGDLYLVDFGTARVKVASPLGHQTTPQKSIYGTPGYAPPEQYQGHTEPRSDVYALAATLYHLATDNDPQSAPYTFPRLAELGQFGEALKLALQQDVTLRPTAQQLRQHLEQCMQTLRQPVQSLPSAVPRFLAPDQSTELHDKQELAAWCEKHWTEARSWLYRGGLSGQIASIWSDTSLADKVEQIARQQPDPDAGVDALMCLLNPNISPPHIQVDDPRVDYGELLADKPNSRAVSLRNDSRRYVCLTFSTPDWISLNKTEVRLRAGDSASIQLEAHPARLPRTAIASAKLEIYVQGGSSVFISITAKPARQKTPEPVAANPMPRPAPVAAAPAPLPTQMRAPDGTLLTNRGDIARWCEDNWLRAGDWIYQLPRDDFVNQLENICRGNIRADTVRTLLSEHSDDRHFALDALLALLDPQGYGAELPKVSGSRSVAFGKLLTQEANTCSIAVKNSGRRYLSLRLEPPAWVSVDNQTPKLLADEEIILTFEAHPTLLLKGVRRKIHDKVTIYCTGKVIGKIPVEATVSLWKLLFGP
jgi:serine/threonine protein kinase